MEAHPVESIQQGIIELFQTDEDVQTVHKVGKAVQKVHETANAKEKRAHQLIRGARAPAAGSLRANRGNALTWRALARAAGRGRPAGLGEQDGGGGHAAGGRGGDHSAL